MNFLFVNWIIEDMVAVMGETTGHLALTNIYRNMLSDSEGKQIIEDNPRINSNTIDIEKLSTLPEESFGRHYYHFLRDNVIINCFSYSMTYNLKATDRT